MSDWFRWWIVIEALAICGLPLCLAVFARLPDRGYTLSKAFGILLIGYTFWILNSAHVLPNQRGGIVAAALLVAAISGVVAWARRREIVEWIRHNWGYVLAIEIAFIYVFAMAVWLRSLVGQISGTEQPMDLMFLNAATQAKHFPPQDPWLSGETVAYYYFGYLLIAMIGQVAGVATEVGYNIGLGMIAALALLGSFGIVFNLVRLREDARREQEPASIQESQTQAERRSRKVAVPAGGSPEADVTPSALSEFNWRPYIFGIAGALMLVVMGNLAWLFKYMAALNIGTSGFYNWLDIDGVTSDQQINHGYPSEFFGFFGATRLYPINGEGFKVITEFPMFSFLLGDLHPHVMALPFVILVAGLALTMFLSDEPLDLAYWVRRPLLLVGGAIMLGSLAFINTWDVVTFGFVIAVAAMVRNWLLRPQSDERGQPRALDSSDNTIAALVGVTHIGAALLIVALLRPSPLISVALVGGAIAWTALFVFYLARGATWPALAETAMRTMSFLVPLVLLAVAAFIPFFDGFSSQAGGVLPVVTRPGVTSAGSRPVQALIYWLPLFVVVVPFVVLRIINQRGRLNKRLILSAAAVPVFVLVAWIALFIVAVEIIDTSKLTGANGFFDQIIDRGSGWITYLLFGALLAAALLALYLEATVDEEDEARTAPLFSLILAVTAFLLILGTEFFYIDDVFHVRMNTVFKLYYQAWVLLALAGGFALYHMLSAWRVTFRRDRVYRYVWVGATAFAFAAAALYTFGGTMNRVRPYDEAGNLIKPREGIDGIADRPRDELAAVSWLKHLSKDQDIVIAEAVGNDYTTAARISGSTGAPAVLGWGGHEDQWRGSTAARAGRFEDIQALYQGDMDQVRRIVNKYGITYIYVGELERTTYGEDALAKFQELPIAYQNDSVTVYRATGEQAEAASPQ